MSVFLPLEFLGNLLASIVEQLPLDIVSLLRLVLQLLISMSHSVGRWDTKLGVPQKAVDSSAGLGLPHLGGLMVLKVWLFSEEQL